MTNEDKPVDLATEVMKKINEDSRAPGTFRKHVFGDSRLTEEEYLARKRQLEAALAEAGVEMIQISTKAAFNAHLPLATPDEVKMFHDDAYLEMRSAARAMTMRIMSDREYDLMARLFDVPRDRAWKRACNRSERLDKKLRESNERVIRTSFSRWTRTTPCTDYIHHHKGRAKPKRGNPWRPTQ